MKVDSGDAAGDTVLFETRIVTYKCPCFVKLGKACIMLLDNTNYLQQYLNRFLQNCF